MKNYIEDNKLKPSFDLIDRVNLSEREKRQAKADLLQAERIVELILRVTTGLKNLTNLVIVKPVRRGVDLVSKPAN